MSEKLQEVKLQSEKAVIKLDWKEIYQLDKFSSVFAKEPGVRYVVANKYYAVGLDKPMLRLGQEITFFSKTDTDAELNGIKNEHMLAILIDRITHQDEKISCQENKDVLENLKKSLHLLEKRTQDRIDRNVEGLETP